MSPLRSVWEEVVSSDTLCYLATALLLAVVNFLWTSSRSASHGNRIIDNCTLKKKKDATPKIIFATNDTGSLNAATATSKAQLVPNRPSIDTTEISEVSDGSGGNDLLLVETNPLLSSTTLNNDSDSSNNSSSSSSSQRRANDFSPSNKQLLNSRAVKNSSSSSVASSCCSLTISSLTGIPENATKAKNPLLDGSPALRSSLKLKRKLLRQQQQPNESSLSSALLSNADQHHRSISAHSFQSSVSSLEKSAAQSHPVPPRHRRHHSTRTAAGKGPPPPRPSRRRHRSVETDMVRQDSAVLQRLSVAQQQELLQFY